MARPAILVCAALIACQTPALANPALEVKVNELSRLIQELQQTVAVQQKEINLLKEGQRVNGAAPSATDVVPVPASATRGRWNPDIGVIADTLFKHDTPRSDSEGADRLSVRELELVFGSFVDPYSRLDANVTFSDFEEVELHEAYLTRFGLPLETTARIGRAKPKAGKALLAHRDILETVDYPIVIQRYFGEDGMSKSGVDLTKPLNLPWESAHEVTVGVIEGGNGNGGTAFGDARRRPTIYSHIKNFWDISEMTNFELGATHMMGSQDADAGFESNVLGVDGTLIHFYGPEQRIKLQSELFYLNQKESLEDNRLGAYSLLDVHFHKRWSAGLRFDYAQLVNQPLVSSGGQEIAGTAYLTFFQTEFSRWRVQYTHIDSSTGKDNDQIMIQGIFAIGEHKHKLQ